jgi:hypothetical protein
MRLPLFAFTLLIGAQTLAAPALETTPEIFQEIQRDSLVGLEAVHLRSLGLVAEPSSEDVLSILAQEIAAAPGLRVASSSREMTAEAPFLRIAYDVKRETLEGRPVFVYWVALDLLQEVSWTWATFPRGKDGGLIPTWSALRTGVASNPEDAASGIRQHTRELGQQFAADFRKMTQNLPQWSIDAMIMEPDGTLRCVPKTEALKPMRTPKPRQRPENP